MNSLKTFLYIIVCSIVPLTSSASIIITEIMYDVPGSDSGREWLELFNNSDESIDISTWRLFEGETNHRLFPQGSNIIQPNSYAVIADNIEQFKVEFPSFSGLLFDSAFSLNNEGELISIRNQELEDIFSVTYNPEFGGKGDGNTLNYVNNSWVSRAPSPGNSIASESINLSSEESRVLKPRSKEDKETEIQKNDYITIQAGDSRTVLAGVRTQFSFEGINRSGDVLIGGEFMWNMGDGTLYKGKEVYHTYRYPGLYTIYLDAQGDGKETFDMFTVTVIPADILIDSVEYGYGGYIRLLNNTNEVVDISNWKLQAGYSVFTLPLHSYIRPRSTFTYAPFDLFLREGDMVTLYTQEYRLISSYSPHITLKEDEYPEEVVVVNQIQEDFISTSTENQTLSEEILFKDNESFLPVESVMASVGSVQEEGISKEDSLLVWLGLLLGLLVVVGATFIYMQKSEQKNEDKIYDR